MIDIKKRRLQLGLTLEEVGEKCGVGKSTVRKWQTGMISNMKRDKMQLLADALRINPVDLLVFPAQPTTPYDLTPTEAGVLSTFRLLDSTKQQTVMQFLLLLTGPNGDRITEDRLRKL